MCLCDADAQQPCPPPVVLQPPQSPLEAPPPGEAAEEVLAPAHVRMVAGGGGAAGADPVKVESMVAAAAAAAGGGGGGGANRPANGPPSGQGYSKYQKSLPPRFQRQQQVSVVFNYPHRLLLTSRASLIYDRRPINGPFWPESLTVL